MTLRYLLDYCLGEVNVSPAGLTFFGETSSAAATEDAKVIKHPNLKNPTVRKTASKRRNGAMSQRKT